MFLCRPNKQTIGKLTNIKNFNLDLKIGTELSELSFNVPKKIKKRDKWVRYEYFDQLRVKYLIRVEAIWGTDNYIIDAPKFSNDNDEWSVHAYLLPHQLVDKKFYSYSTTSSDGTDSPITIVQALTDALSLSYSWSIGHIDDSLKSLYRSFEIDDQYALDFIQTIADKFNAVVTWDTVNNKVNMYDSNTFTGQNRGFRISEKKYLKSLEEDLSDDMITRLHCFGADNISLNSVNPTGQDYIEDYTYFLGSFERDSNKKALSHSEWITDNLCNALLDYQELVQSKTGDFNNLLAQLNTNQSSLLSLQTDMTSLNTDLSIIQDMIAVYSKSDDYFYIHKVNNGKGWSYRAELNDFQQYMIMGKSTNSISCKIDGIPYSLNSTWKVLKKLNNVNVTNIVLSSSQSLGEISFVIVMIESDEYSASGNESTLLNKYNLYSKQDQISAKQAQLDLVNAAIISIQNQINTLKNSLSVENNFTREQLIEWDNFIKEDTFSDSNYIDANDLMKDGKVELMKRQQPSDSFSISIVNFLQIVECQKDWDKIIFLNDIITIYYDNGAKIVANLSEANIDFDGGTISLTIANSKHAKTQDDKNADVLNQTIQAAVTQNKRKHTWNGVTEIKSTVDNYLNNSIYANKQSVVAGINNTEQFGKFGLLSRDGDNVTIMYRACILGSNDGGNTWKSIYTPDGINAEQVIGQLMLDENTSVVSKNGDIQLTYTGGSFSNSGIAIEGGLPASQIDSNVVNNAQYGAQAKDQIDNLDIGAFNLAAKKNIFGSVTTLTQSIGHSDYGLTLDYNVPNGFSIPVKVADSVTISFIAYANLDNIKLFMSLNTKGQSNLTPDYDVTIGTQSQKYRWTLNYNDPNIDTVATLLKFWHVQAGVQVMVQDIQFEDGNMATAWRTSYLDLQV